MQYKELGRTGFEVSSVSFGAWAIGGTWGQVDDAEAMRCLHRALDLGVIGDLQFFRHGGRLWRRAQRTTPGALAARAARSVLGSHQDRAPLGNPHVKESYNRENLTQYVERCLKNLEVSALDLVQIHVHPLTSSTCQRCSGC